MLLATNPYYFYFSELILSPEIDPKTSSRLSAPCRERTVPFSLREVSSANCVILKECLLVLIPITSGVFSNKRLNILADKMKR